MGYWIIRVVVYESYQNGKKCYYKVMNLMKIGIII